MYSRALRRCGWLLLALLAAMSAACRPTPTPENSYSGAIPAGAVARLGKGSAAALTFGAEGAFYSGGADGLHRYAADGLAPQWATATHEPVRTISVSADGERLLAGLDDGTLLLLDTTDGSLVEQWPGYNPNVRITAIAWQPVGDEHGVRAVAAFVDGNALLINVGEEVQTIGGLPRQASAISALTFNPDGRILATGNSDGLVHLIDINGQRLVATFNDQDAGGAITALAWSPRGDQLTGGGHDGVVIEWDLNDMAAAQIWPPEEASIASLAYLDGGARLALGTEEGVLEQWRVGQTVDGAHLEIGRPLRALAWDANQGRFATATSDGTVAVWLIPEDGGWPEAPDVTVAGYAAAGETSAVAAYDEEGRRLLSSLGRAVVVWDVKRQAPLQRYEGHQALVTTAAWSPDGTLVASGDRDGVVHVWKARDGALQAILSNHTHAVGDLAWSPDGRLLASTGSLADELMIWDAKGALPLARLGGDGDGLWAVAFSPDGSELAAGSTGGKLFIWQTADWSAPPEQYRRHESWVSDIAWDQEGRRLLTAGGDKLVLLWDLEHGNSSLLAGHDAPVRGVAFSPDETGAVSVAIDGEIIFWDLDPLATEPLLRRLSGHSDGVTGVDWAADGKTIATSSEDGTVVIWDALDKTVK
ncbi:MAG: hypothetical protein ACK2UK_10285 [Candidatus Promineifilaceae bacterium]